MKQDVAIEFGSIILRIMLHVERDLPYTNLQNYIYRYDK